MYIWCTRDRYYIYIFDIYISGATSKTVHVTDRAITCDLQSGVCDKQIKLIKAQISEPHLSSVCGNLIICPCGIV